MRAVFIISIILLIPVIGYSQTTWYVDGTNTSGPWLGTQADPFQYIQDGIDAASNGDTVLVLPYTYVENIDFIGKAITVTSDKGPDVSVIDGGNPSNPDFGSVVMFQSGEGLDSVLEGFTIMNGTGTLIGSGHAGGGILCNNTSPTIMNNIIKENNCGAGGGIACGFGGSPNINKNIITKNSAENYTDVT